MTKFLGTANQTYSTRGRTFVADGSGVVTASAPTGNELHDLIAGGCSFLSPAQGVNNFAATTNPGATNDNTQDYAIGSLWLNVSTGSLYIATAVGTGTASWATVGAAGQAGLPWATGNFYGLGKGVTPEAVLSVLGTLYAYPIFIPNRVTLSSINYSVTTGQTGGKVRGALFSDNGAGYPGAIVPGTDTGDLAGTGTAVVTKGSLAKVLNPGWYWLGTIATASSTMPSVIGAKVLYTNELTALLGQDTAAHALATSAEAATGLAVTGQTYPATDMTTSFATFPASAAITLNADTPIAALGV